MPRRIGLRRRVGLALAFGAATASLLLALVTYGVARTYLLRQRETSVLRQSYAQARLVRDRLATDPLSANEALADVSPPADVLGLLHRDDKWYGDPIATTRRPLPDALEKAVQDGDVAYQRVEWQGRLWTVVGIPLQAVDADYYLVYPLDELPRSLNVLRLSLLLAAIITTTAGGTIGWRAGRQLLRPLADAADAAQRLADGDLESRLTPTDDPDLSILVDSFNTMAVTLADRIEREERFTSDVSHELRSPLTTVMGSVEILQTIRPELPDRARVAVDLLTSDIERFRRLIEDLLEISRLDAGVANLALEPARIDELVTETIGPLAPDAPMEIDPRVATEHVALDKRRIQAAIRNLVENAQTHGGGIARITIRRLGDTVQVAVEDSGPGIPPAEREQVFERFHRGSVAGRRQTSTGMGLGLALAAEHVQLHDGRIRIESRSQEPGCRVVIELPVDLEVSEEA